MDYQILPVIIKRKSIFSFSERPVEHEKLMLLFDAARKAPSSMNIQPWRFIYAVKDEDEVYNKMVEILDEGNKLWAVTAPVLILSLAEMIMEYKKRPNRFAFHDLGLAMGNLLVQASHLDLYAHPMGGFDISRAKQLFSIPSGFEPVTIIALGYKGNPDILTPELQSREKKERKRKEISEFVFKGYWKIGI